MGSELQGWSLIVWDLVLGDLGQENIGLVFESKIKEAAGGMGPGLVGLYMEGMFTGKLLTMSRS